jgi:Family of unknown function (DUF6334)
MGARGFLREKVAALLYDELEPFKLSTGELLSVYAQEDAQWLNLNFSGGGLFLRAEANDDTIVSRNARDFAGIAVSQTEPWQDFVGKSIFLGWLGANSQGYIDTALIGFSGAVPEIAITAVASELNVSRLGEWRRASEL